MFEKKTNYFDAFRISISLATLAEIFIQTGYFFKIYAKKNKSGCLFLNKCSFMYVFGCKRDAYRMLRTLGFLLLIF